MALVEGKVAVVTGGGRGIGRGYALALAKEGADVVIADINDDDGHGVVKEIEALGRQAMYVNTDVSSAAATTALAGAIGDRFGGLDIVVNNASIFAGLPTQTLENLDEQLWDKVMAVNVKGTWLMCRAMLPLLRSRGGGCIVNQASTGPYLSAPGRMHYNVSKSSVIMITKTLAKELGPEGIRVNAIAPGPVETEALKGVPKEALDRAVAGMAIKRLGQPEDMAGGLIFLCSDLARWMTGQTIVIDGGSVMLG